MGGGTTSSSTENRPLTAAERQDIYNGAVGNIKNTYIESGLPVGGQGSMNTTAATFNPNGSTLGSGTGAIGAASGNLYNAAGSASQDSNQSGMKSLNPFGLADTPNMQMPTGSASAGGINFPTYQTPTYQSAGDFQKGGYTAGLDYAKAQDASKLNSDLASRGIWSSGLAEQATKDLNSAYSGAYEKAGADQATAQNQYNLNAANQANQFNQTNAQNQFTSGWAPLNYLSSIWSGTAGNVGGSNSFGANINI
ncbi:hypothetical protein F6V30_13965 [Oryzomonas sagensis]|uniref:Tail fiber domain-containing protein n=1 Tax=Oryzomonas sagensis TaxID=2603857 RepID=A0ABQ6TL70_9BACT|nr:hypothetical protein [Oryzomonas sagensis]KAB0668939.1 hypothetical protein F6V30_13965 [Oryzomonas sagensis]